MLIDKLMLLLCTSIFASIAVNFAPNHQMTNDCIFHFSASGMLSQVVANNKGDKKGKHKVFVEKVVGKLW